jgi:acyl carrier protein
MHTQLLESQVRDKVRAYLQDNFLYMRLNFILGDDDRLLERGVVDSMGVVEMIAFLEEEFGIKTSDEEITERNLGCLSAIARFVCAKRAVAAA